MTTSPAIPTLPEVLDLRHFGAVAMRPLLETEAARWEQRLSWDYSRSVELLLEYIDNRSLSGYVAVRQGRVAGYAFGVCEAAKAVMGDLYAFGEGEQLQNPVCSRLLTHLLETLQNTPGIHRIESQLLLFPQGSFGELFTGRGFKAFPRFFMQCDLRERPRASERRLPVHLQIERWSPEAYLAAAALIQAAYVHHTDADINDQYRTLQGAQRFLHNIVHFPGCGQFDAANSWLLHDTLTGELAGMVLCSRVREDAAHITQLCVRDGLRGRGLGAALLQRCLAHLAATPATTTVSLTVTSSNIAATSLYKQEGFAIRHHFDAWVWDDRSAR